MDYKFSMDFGNGFVDVPQPFNHSAIKIDAVYTSGNPSASISSVNFEWIGEVAHKINDYIAQGLTGGRGIYEGIPLKIEACNQNLGFNLSLDLANASTRIECDRIVCPIRESGRIDWLNDIAGSFTFWYLATPTSEGGAGIITANDYKATPYTVTGLPDMWNDISLGISTFIVGYDLYETTQQLVEDIARFSSVDIPQLIASIALVIADLIKMFLEIHLLVELIDTLINDLIQHKKYKLCMRIEDLFRKGCQYLGIGFESSIFSDGAIYKNATWMPRKLQSPVDNFDSIINWNFKKPYNELGGGGNPYGYYDGTFKEFIQDMMMIFNAEVKVNNNTLYFEEIHHWNTQDAFLIDNTDDEGFTFNLPAPHGTNASECPSVYALQFQLDNDELNTIHRYEGTTATVQVQPFVTGDKRNLLNPPGVVIQLPCALAKRKDYLSRSEIKLNKIIVTANSLIQVVQENQLIIEIALSGPLLSALLAGIGVFHPNEETFQFETIDEHIGWLELSNDTFTIPKIFIGTQIGTDWKLSWENNSFMTANSLMYWFHGLNLATRGNQWLTYYDKKFKFCCADFQKALNSNVFQVRDENGQVVYGKFTKILWDLETEIAIADYRINRLYTTNLTERLIIDGLDGNVIGLGGSSGGNGSGGGGGGTQWPQ